MPENERGHFDLAMQVAELRADVRHVQSDTTDIKAELRATNQRIDSLSQKTDERFERLEQKFDQLKDSPGVGQNPGTWAAVHRPFRVAALSASARIQVALTALILLAAAGAVCRGAIAAELLVNRPKKLSHWSGAARMV